jgi:hypothetical protein
MIRFGVSREVNPLPPGVDALTHGASVTLTSLNGVALSGLGTKTVAAPSWQDCEAGVDGAPFGTTGAVYPNWESYPTGKIIGGNNTTVGLTPPSYDGTQSRGGAHCTKSVRQYYGDVDYEGVMRTQYGQYVELPGLPASQAWYVSFWRRCEVPAGSAVFDAVTGSRNWKHLGLRGPNPGYLPGMRHDCYPCNGEGHFYFDWTDAAYSVEPNKYWDDVFTAITWQHQWQRFDYFVDRGSVNGSDWRIALWIDGVVLHDFTVADQAGRVGPPNDEYFSRILINNYLAQETSNAAYANLPVEFWLDDFYVDSSLARVELGDAATWVACTQKEIQPWTAWADGSVTVTVNHGALPHGTQYLYAVKPDGTPFDTNGQPVVLA